MSSMLGSRSCDRLNRALTRARPYAAPAPFSMRFFEFFSKATPLSEKVLATAGAAVGGSLTLGHINTAVGVSVGVLTALMLVPRVVLAWRDLLRQLRHEEREDSDEP